MPVTSRWVEGYHTVTDVVDVGHVLVGDEPEKGGGTNEGPHPVAFLLTSLSTCTIVTVVGEASLLGVELDGVEVHVAHKQDRAVSGPADPDQRGMRITELRRRITLRGELSDEQVERLRWAAENCPVSTTLARAVDIRTVVDHEPRTGASA